MPRRGSSKPPAEPVVKPYGCDFEWNWNYKVELAMKDRFPTYYDPDSGGDPISIHCQCGIEFCAGTHDWDEFVKEWNTRT